MKALSIYTDTYKRRWHGPFPFTKNAVETLAANIKGVYQILYYGSHTIEVAYIGIATGDTIRGLLSKHVNGSGNWALARLGDSNKFQFVYYECDEITAKQIESNVILTEKPPFNTKLVSKHFIPNIYVH